MFLDMQFIFVIFIFVSIILAIEFLIPALKERTSRNNREYKQSVHFHKGKLNRSKASIKMTPQQAGHLNNFVKTDLIPSLVTVFREEQLNHNTLTTLVTELVNSLSDEWLSEYYLCKVNKSSRGKNHSKTIRKKLVTEIICLVTINLEH